MQFSLFLAEFAIRFTEIDWDVIESDESVGIEIEAFFGQNFILPLNPFTVRVTPITMADSLTLGNLVTPPISSLFSPNLAGKFATHILEIVLINSTLYYFKS